MSNEKNMKWKVNEVDGVRVLTSDRWAVVDLPHDPTIELRNKITSQLDFYLEVPCFVKSKKDWDEMPAVIDSALFLTEQCAEGRRPRAFRIHPRETFDPKARGWTWFLTSGFGTQEWIMGPDLNPYAAHEHGDGLCVLYVDPEAWAGRRLSEVLVEVAQLGQIDGVLNQQSCLGNVSHGFVETIPLLIDWNWKGAGGYPDCAFVSHPGDRVMGIDVDPWKTLFGDFKMKYEKDAVFGNMTPDGPVELAGIQAGGPDYVEGFIDVIPLRGDSGNGLVDGKPEQTEIGTAEIRPSVRGYQDGLLVSIKVEPRSMRDSMTASYLKGVYEFIEEKYGVKGTLMAADDETVLRYQDPMPGLNEEMPDGGVGYWRKGYDAVLYFRFDG